MADTKDKENTEAPEPLFVPLAFKWDGNIMQMTRTGLECTDAAERGSGESEWNFCGLEYTDVNKVIR